ncbi:MAG: spermidine/putrescine ABC transporter substrate-binding protein [Thermoleophilia bacterium]|nr:spermidine/putrescine ABC transporter substrate-binding protein [Gaiellaceae bacterium]MDW8337752.1 spermidine/putrescine ABC transporter substrate-binding protein [Thermoleophilia bacterium]
MNPRMTRDELLRRGAAGLSVLSLPTLLAACGGGGGGEGSGELKDVLNFANWPLYIDIDEETKERPTLNKFTEETGIKVNYYEEINDNATYFAKIQGPLSQGRSIDRDIIVLTDTERPLNLILENGWAEKLDKSLIPNIENLIPAQQSPPFDPNRDYTLPWQSGMTGIAWNPKLTEPVRSISQLLDDPNLKGKVTMLSGFADTVGLVMLDNGDDPSAVTDESFQRVIDRVQAAVDSGQIRRFTGNDYAEPLSRGTIAACVAWSGDIVQLQLDNPDLEFAIPEAGGMIWTDNMLIPKGGSVPTACTFMNFVYDPVNMAAISAYVNFIPPVAGTKEIILKEDPELAENQLIFPDDETLARLHQIDAKAIVNDEYLEQWQSVIGA